MKVHVLNIKVTNTHTLSVSTSKIRRSTIGGMTICSTCHGQLRREVWHIHFLTTTVVLYFNGNNSPKPTVALGAHDHTQHHCKFLKKRNATQRLKPCFNHANC